MKKLWALTVFLLSTSVLAKDHFIFATKNFDREIFPAWGGDTEKTAARMTEVTVTVSDDTSGARPGVEYNGKVIGYDPKDYLVINIHVLQGASSILDDVISIPRNQLPLKEGDDFICPQADFGFARITYENGRLNVSRAIDPKDVVDALRRSQNDEILEISPDLSCLKSMKLHHYNVKHVRTLLLGLHVFDHKESTAKISAQF